MRNRIAALALVVALALALSVPVLADGDQVSGPGFYAVGSATNLTVTPLTAAGAEVTRVTATINDKAESFYPGSARLSVTLSGAASGAQYAVMLVQGTDIPTQDNAIFYIDQKAAGDTVSFDVYPTLSDAQSMTLYITSSATGFTTIRVPVSYAASGNYEIVPYTLGDVDGVNSINATDALLALQISGRVFTDYTENQYLAADVNRKDGVNATDALLILQYSGHVIDEWPQ